MKTLLLSKYLKLLIFENLYRRKKKVHKLSLLTVGPNYLPTSGTLAEFQFSHKINLIKIHKYRV